ncbi:MAG: S8 family serine peptidase [Planctomycetota bacterium]
MRFKISIAVLFTIALGLPAAVPADNADRALTIVQWQGRDIVDRQVLVQFIAGTPLPAQSLLHQTTGTELLRQVSDELALVEVPAGASIDEVMARYSREGDVRVAEPNFVCWATHVPNDPGWGNQYGPQQIRCPQAWDTYRGGGSSVVAIIDTGVRMSHDDLDANYVFGYDYYSGDSNPSDNAGHGTHVAGISAAETNNGFGMAGVGYTQLYAAYRCGDGSLPADALVSAINDAVAKGAHVLNMSWGSRGEISTITIALNNAYEAGVVNVAAAGNEGNDRPFYPAYGLNVIGVAATDSSENRAGYSNYGEWVSVCAPGDNIYSSINWSDDAFTWLSGTSMASPHVAGVAGFLYSRLGGVRSRANSNRIRDVLQSTARPKDFVKYGLVDLEAALAALDNGEGDPDNGEPPGNCTRPDRYGNGTPGTGGVLPRVRQDSYGWLGNHDWQLLLEDALPNSPGVFLIGFKPASDTSGGYERLVTPILTVPITTSGSGAATLNISLPRNPFLDGFSLYVQAVVNDPGASAGLAASEGYHVVLCWWDQ